MKKILIMITMIAFSACSRPVSPPVTPAQPPTVEQTPTTVPAPTVDSATH